MNRKTLAITLVTIVFLVGSLTGSLASDMNRVLQDHDPRADDNSSSSPAPQVTPAAETPAGSPASPPPQSVIDLIDEITKVMEEIAKILEEKADEADAASEGETGSQGDGSTYTVQSGDTLWGIAQRFLGAGNRYWDIVEANKDRYPSIAKNPNLIYPGWKLVIPGGNGGGPSTSGGSRPPPAPSPAAGNPPAVSPPAPGARGPKALLGWLQQVGLSGDALRTAWAIGMRESGGNPSAHNGNRGTGDNSYGLFQINMLGNMGPARLRQFGLTSYDQLFDPMTNCRAMMKLSNNGRNWGPWGVGPNAYRVTDGPGSAFQRYYNQFPPR